MKVIFPNKIPVFPLSGVIYFPKTNLPLNVFEKRYLELVNDCMKNNKLMGMVQLIGDTNKVYRVGCLGKIEALKKTDDGRILLNLNGLTRFEIIKEINSDKLYREFEVNYNKFKNDLELDKEVQSITSTMENMWLITQQEYCIKESTITALSLSLSTDEQVIFLYSSAYEHNNVYQIDDTDILDILIHKRKNEYYIDHYLNKF